MNDSEYHRIWRTMTRSGIKKNGSQKGPHEKTILIVEDKTIDSLSSEAKKIVALYTKFIPEYIINDKKAIVCNQQTITEALGGFAALELAQNSLVDSWGNEVQPCRSFGLSLSILQTGNRISCITYVSGDKIEDIYEINLQGEIIYHKPDQEHVPYNRKLIDEQYSLYNVRLNGEHTYLSNIFLDEENIESIILNKREHTIDITQKNKNPKYFSKSDIDYASFGIDVKPDLIIILYIMHGYGRAIEFSEHTKLESNAIHGIEAEKHSNDTIEWYYIYIKTY